MPIDAEELEGRFYELRLEEEAHHVNARTDTVACALIELQSEFEEFKASLINDFNTLIDKLQACARAQDLVDEQGGSLDEFLESFRRY